jgi:hypothetical protein
VLTAQAPPMGSVITDNTIEPGRARAESAGHAALSSPARRSTSLPESSIARSDRVPRWRCSLSIDMLRCRTQRRGSQPGSVDRPDRVLRSAACRLRVNGRAQEPSTPEPASWSGIGLRGQRCRSRARVARRSALDRTVSPSVTRRSCSADYRIRRGRPETADRQMWRVGSALEGHAPTISPCPSSNRRDQTGKDVHAHGLRERCDAVPGKSRSDSGAA